LSLRYLLDTNTCVYAIKRWPSVLERDLLIAATAVARGLAVVTNNVSEFGRGTGLRLEDWSKA